LYSVIRREAGPLEAIMASCGLPMLMAVTSRSAEKHLGRQAWFVRRSLYSAEPTVAQRQWLAKAEKHAGKRAWMATMPWYTDIAATVDDKGVRAEANSYTESQRRWLAQAEKHAGKRAWLATMPCYNEMRDHAFSPQTFAISADQKEMHADMKSHIDTQHKSLAKAEKTVADTAYNTSLPGAFVDAEAHTEVQRKWLAKAEKHIGKQAWLATMPWYNPSNCRASSPQMTASSVDEKEFHADANSYTEAQLKWFAKAEKHAGKRAWMATMPWYNDMKNQVMKQTIESKAIEREAPFSAQDHLQHLFAAQIRCAVTEEQQNLTRPVRSATSAETVK